MENKTPLRQTTLCFLTKENQILLAMKKRGFGMGRWNGVGGKLKPGESVEEAVIRESQEEINVKPLTLDFVADLSFYFPDHPEWNQQVLAYFSNLWEKVPQESDEMRPKWFSTQELPFEEMWPDDVFWLPKVIEGQKIKAEFVFGENDKILDYSMRELSLLAVEN